MYKDLVNLIVENQFLVSKKDNEVMNGGKFLILVETDDIQQNPDQIMEDRFAKVDQQFKALQLKLNQ